nr:xanthine dehydrogenase 1-like [Danaus plexippus plexippus]
MDRVHFRVNGVHCSVGNEVSSSITLLEYLRRHLELRGTKYMCLEGGCGACIVNVTKHPGGESQGVNSCMVPITSCNEWDITTIEGIGNRLHGYHPIQVTLAENNGTQCGYCSPGWVMAMYSILKNKKPTMLEVEQSFGSNICRCTGYRPILDAFKKFASDAHDVLDIEDLEICKKSGRPCAKNSCDESDWCLLSKNELNGKLLHIILNDNRDWFKATCISDIFEIFQKWGTESYMLLAGNTGKGVYPILEYPRVLINVNDVKELREHYIDQNLVIGGATTLTELINIFDTVGRVNFFGYLKILNEHLQEVAHIPIRNNATIAGNLMLKNLHPDFKSDIFILFETIGAQLTIQTGRNQLKIITMQSFLSENMHGKILLNVLLPPLSTEHKIVTFKITPRSQNAHALIHAGFLYKVDHNERVLESRIVYGGLSPSYTRSWKTERYLIGKQLLRNETLQGALKVLNTELVVTESLPDPSVQYRRQVALALFYKGLLSLCAQNRLNPRYVSGSSKIHKTRPVSEGTQIFDTNPSLWPLNKPIPKLDGLIQCAGEAKYSEDVPRLPGEVFAAFVLTTVALGKINHIDASRALEEPGVLAFYTAADILGRNSFIPAVNLFNRADEEFLCNGEVKYFNQPLGIIVAECQSIADKAVHLVQVIYSDIKNPVLDIRVAKHDPSKLKLFQTINATSAGTDIAKVIKGEQSIYTQYPFTMETLVTVTHPTEEGLRIYAATQWMDSVHVVISRALLLDQNRIDILVRRLGGGYGYKLSRVTQVSLGSALVAYKLNRPCRFIQSLSTNMRATGKRFPCSTSFEYPILSRQSNTANIFFFFGKYNTWDPIGTQYLEVNMCVYYDDGTVALTHAGIEMGQGINTKAIQIAAYFLKIPIEKIQVKPNDTVIAPNCFGSGGSITSQNIGIGVQRCCEELLRRLEPVRNQLNNPSWEELVKKAYEMNVDLQVHDLVSAKDEQKYNIYGVTLAEVEIDVLTGEWEIMRVDLIEDVGRSVNPELDLGQIEGAFIMGVGYWTTENIVYGPENGEILTDRTWEYWVPGPRDIPQDFRVYFRKRSFSTEKILGAKASGEPATCMGISVPFAMRAAIASTRKESGMPEWFQIDGPFTVDKIYLACATKFEDFKFY